MRLIHHLAELRATLAGEREIAFVPTMGNLHAGHLALIDKARQAGHPVVASIFVNPLQFGVGEDFERYPRTLDADRAQLFEAGCDILFAPEMAEVYPEPQGFMVLPPLADELCGVHRPGHFAGVCTVVLKLFNMVQPRYAIFGKKDYQQLHLLRHMTRQFNLPIEIIGLDTLRAADGLALSSRNGYLSSAERNEAPRLYRVLTEMAQQLRAGAPDCAALEAQATSELESHGWEVDYVSVRAQSTLLAAHENDHARVILAAARLGNTRLIDNLEVTLL
jgi:pantoate--beta-alanine ligase